MFVVSFLIAGVLQTTFAGRIRPVPEVMFLVHDFWHGTQRQLRAYNHLTCNYCHFTVARCSQSACSPGWSRVCRRSGMYVTGHHGIPRLDSAPGSLRFSYLGSASGSLLLPPAALKVILRGVPVSISD